jgi:hypothetical protein
VDEKGHLGCSAALVVLGHVFAQADVLVGIRSDGQEDVIGSIDEPLVKGSRDNRDLDLVEILGQGQVGPGGIAEEQHNSLIEKVLEVAFGHGRLVHVVADRQLYLGIAENLGVVDQAYVVFRALGIRVAGIRGRAGDRQRQTELVGFGGLDRNRERQCQHHCNRCTP